MTKIKPNRKADPERVRKYSCLIDKAFPAMSGSHRRRWAEHDAMAAEWFGLEVEAVKDLGDGVMAINGGIWDGTYDDMADMLRDGDFHTLKINSEGGAATVGIAAYHLVKEAGLRVEVDGIAFSAATDIAVAGDPLVIKRGASIGIHRPWTLAIGNYDDLRDEADFMEVMSDAMFELYSARAKSKKKLAEMKDLYMKDSLLTGAEAVRLGLADEYEGDAKESEAKAERESPTIAVDASGHFRKADELAEETDSTAAQAVKEEPKQTWAEFRAGLIGRR